MNFLFWKKENKLSEEKKLCHCGNGKLLEDCHELEHALPIHERPDPD